MDFSSCISHFTKLYFYIKSSLSYLITQKKEEGRFRFYRQKNGFYYFGGK